ncbi:thioesterase [Rhodococcus sp. ACPA4]|uniref:PaaI family thioesterase n=1 Tax=Rhodococcus sp. ACPA4 TaxID=2028571 RepID=UPI000BB12352|nr:PaaI family thioesterase [Rhodococcus sp. ACPA4]PBC42763.1 thioesterase [Rhodococcus sp. ACPA4]
MRYDVDTVAQQDSDEVARAVASVRRLTAAVAAARSDMPGLSAVASRIHALADDLEARSCSAAERVNQMNTIGRIVRYSPVVGSANVLAAPLHLRHIGDGNEGTVTFSVAHQGSLGVVHEGFAAMVLDVALAEANMAAGVPAMTAGLTLRYHHPMPVCCDLTVRAWHVYVDGRKSWCRGEIWREHDLCVSAEGLFIVPREGGARGQDRQG